MEERWLRLHLTFAPFGTILVTWLLSLGVGAWQWGLRDDLEPAGQLMPLGAACYAAFIVVNERTGRMFWALAQREKDRQRWREEALREGREDERARIERELAQRA